jgi:hypothetical protein
MLPPTIKLRVLKSWVSQDMSLILQAQPLAPREMGPLPKKLHLIIDVKQQSFGLRLGGEKPTDATANHALIQILRKHCPSFTIRWIWQDASTGSLWIPLLAGPEQGQPWMLRLARSKPPLLSLISPDQIIHVSFGQKGTFTKKHALEEPMPEQGMHDILPSLTQSLLASREQATMETGAALQDSENLALQDDNQAASEPREASGGSEDLLPKAQRELSSRLKRKLKTIKKTREKLTRDLPSHETVQRLERQAQLLQSYAYLLKDESIELRLDAATTGLDHDLSIPLDPELSRGQQIEAAFQAWRKARRGREIGLKQLDMAVSQTRDLEEDIAQLLAHPFKDAQLQVLVRKYKLPDLTSPRETRSNEGGAKPYKTYRSSTGHSILVGKGSLENDELTKAARSNDYWFHAVGVTGSHVIVPVTPDIREALPTSLIREAAILALHFSRFKDDLAGECYITRKAHLKKQKGMPAGLWRIDQSESIFFRYNKTELDGILQTIQV